MEEGLGVGVQQKRETSLGRGGKGTQAPPPVLGTRVTRPGTETLGTCLEECGLQIKVMFQDGQGGCGLSVLEGNESSQLPTGS